MKRLILCPECSAAIETNSYGRRYCPLCSKEKKRIASAKRRAANRPDNPRPCLKCGGPRTEAYGRLRCEPCYRAYQIIYRATHSDAYQPVPEDQRKRFGPKPILVCPVHHTKRVPSKWGWRCRQCRAEYCRTRVAHREPVVYRAAIPIRRPTYTAQRELDLQRRVMARLEQAHREQLATEGRPHAQAY
jgi:hypothetical protein